MNEILDVNIEDAPPDQKTLDRFLDQASDNYRVFNARKRRKMNLGIVLVIFLIATSITILSVDVRNTPLYFSLALLVFGIVGSVLSIFNATRKIPEGGAGISLRRFNKLTNAQAVEYETHINGHPKIKEYMKKVNEMGRPPVFADLEAAREWVDRKTAQTARERMASI